jgi:voltage-gated potassium channel
MFKPLRDMARDPEGKVLVMSAMATVAVGTFVYSALEGWSLIDALYFSVVTLATVGFGDLTPTTDIAKLFTVGYIVTGIGILAAFATELAKHRGAPLVERIRTASSVEHEIVEETEELVGGPAKER